MQLAAHVERGGELGWRLRPERETVPEQAVAQHEIERRQLEQRRSPQLVAPAHARVADPDLPLQQHPLGDSRVLRLRRMQLDARHVELARCVAPDFQARPVEHERIEPRRSDQRRNPGDRRLDPGQGQGGAAVVIVDRHVGEEQIRPQAPPARLDRADGDALAQRFRRVLLDVAPVLADSRENRVAQDKHGCGKQQIDDKQPPADQARNGAPPAFRRDGVLDCFLDGLLEFLERLIQDRCACRRGGFGPAYNKAASATSS